MVGGKLWTQRDRYGNDIYLTAERWQHITDPDNHPDIEPFAEYVRETVRNGRREQVPLQPDTYRYIREFDNLPDYQTHVVVVVVFRRGVLPGDGTPQGNFVVTAYLKEID